MRFTRRHHSRSQLTSDPMLKIYTALRLLTGTTPASIIPSVRRASTRRSKAWRAPASASAIVRDADAHPDTDRIIHKVHSADYERELEEAVRARLALLPLASTIRSPRRRFAAARAAVATSLAAADDIWKRDESKRAFVIARPPGHHAERARGDGLLLLQHHRLRRRMAARAAGHRARLHLRLRRPPRQRHAASLRRARRRLLRVDPSLSVLSRHRRRERDRRRAQAAASR